MTIPIQNVLILHIENSNVASGCRALVANLDREIIVAKKRLFCLFLCKNKYRTLIYQRGHCGELNSIKTRLIENQACQIDGNIRASQNGKYIFLHCRSWFYSAVINNIVRINIWKNIELHVPLHHYTIIKYHDCYEVLVMSNLMGVDYNNKSLPWHNRRYIIRTSVIIVSSNHSHIIGMSSRFCISYLL